MRKSSSCLIGLRRCVTQHLSVPLVRACATVPLYKTLHFSKELAESLLQGIAAASAEGAVAVSEGPLRSGPVRFGSSRVVLFRRLVRPPARPPARPRGTELIRKDAELRQVVGNLPGQVGDSRRTVQASGRREPRGLETSVQGPEPRRISGDSQPGCEDVCGGILPADREVATQT